MGRFTTNQIENSVIHLLNGDFNFPTSLTIEEVINTNQHKWEPAEPMLAYLTEDNGSGTRKKVSGPTRLLIKPPTYGSQDEYTYGTNSISNALENCLTDTVLYPRFGGINGLEDQTHMANLYDWSIADLREISSSLPAGSVFTVAMSPNYLEDYVDMSGMTTTDNEDEGFIGNGNVPLLSMIKDGNGNYIPILSNENGTKWFVGDLPTDSMASVKWEQLNAVHFQQSDNRVFNDLVSSHPNVYPVAYIDYSKRTGSSISNNSFKCDDFRMGNVAYDEDSQRLSQIISNEEITPYLLRNDTAFYDVTIPLAYNSTTSFLSVSLDNYPIGRVGIDTYYTVNLTDEDRSNVLVIEATPDPGRIYYLLVMNTSSATKTVSMDTSNTPSTVGVPENALELNPGYAMEFSFYGNQSEVFADTTLVITHSEELKINTQSA